jgi:crotonobetainyl-CoA:carnitine CoA-transferase CaiB-like acyl-CoA transferase
LLQRAQTNAGTQLEVSLFETAMAFLAYNFQIYWEKGKQPDKCGSGHESLCPYQAFMAADKPILIGVANDNLWGRFCRAVGRPELADDPRFRTSPDRVAHKAKTVALVQEIIGARTCDEWLELLTGLGVPCAPINTLQEALDHPHTAARGIVLDYHHPTLGPLKSIAPPIQFNGAARTMGAPPPMHGEHTRAVLHELGYADADIAALAAAGVIATGAGSP